MNLSNVRYYSVKVSATYLTFWHAVFIVFDYSVSHDLPVRCCAMYIAVKVCRAISRAIRKACRAHAYH